MTWPFAAGLARLFFVFAVGGWWMNVLHGSLSGLYWIVAASYLLFGSINAFVMASGLGWGSAKRRARDNLKPETTK